VETRASAVEIISLWPSLFLEADLPGFAAPTERLIALAATRGDDGVFSIDDPGVDWLKRQIAHGVGAYLVRSGRGRAQEWGAHGRFDVREPGGYRPLANEPGAFLAGMYVMQWSPEQDAGGHRDDALPGCVSFYDPRVGMNMNAIKRDPYHRYHHSLLPRPGLLSIWPAHISYFVHPNRSREPTMAVRFGVQLHPRSEGS
jgi:hypothetical protein